MNSIPITPEKVIRMMTKPSKTNPLCNSKDASVNDYCHNWGLKRLDRELTTSDSSEPKKRNTSDNHVVIENEPHDPLLMSNELRSAHKMKRKLTPLQTNGQGAMHWYSIRDIRASCSRTSQNPKAKHPAPQFQQHRTEPITMIQYRLLELHFIWWAI